MLSRRSLAACVAVMKWMPKNAMSRLAGRIAGAELPQPLQRWQIAAFGHAVGVDFAEAREPIESFASLQAFFIRELRADARPIDESSEALVSPCDGAWGIAGTVSEGQILQVKGRPYSLAQLLGDDDLARSFEGGDFATLYLSPRDYHRFHTPCDLEVLEARYLPGHLWPVNQIGVEGVEGVFAENERISAVMQTHAGSGPARFCIVAVGATMVGGVRVEFDDLATNRRGATAEHRVYSQAPPRFAKGEEWGHFEFGSTLVLVLEPGLLRLDPEPVGTPVRLGTRIGAVVRDAGS
jgi:phosphatidylserine decarboxylase